MKKVIAFGEGLIDFLPVSDKLSLAETEEFRKTPGGAVANVAVAVAKLGGHSYFIGQLGADAFGDFLIKTMKEYGVNTEYSFRTDRAKTGIVFLSESKNEVGGCIPFRRPSADMLVNVNDIKPIWFKHAEIFHFGSDTLIFPEALKATLKAIDYAKANQMIISFDINLRPGLWQDRSKIEQHLESVLPNINILKMNDFEFRFLMKIFATDHLVEHLLKKGVNLLIKTNKEGKTAYYTKDLAGEVEVEANNLESDYSLGAGDAFVGGLLYKLSNANLDHSGFLSFIRNKKKLEEYLQFANDCGTFSTLNKGTMPSFPTINLLEDWKHH